MGIFRTVFRLLYHSFAVVFLTILTQLGGIAWLISCAFRSRLPAFLVTYFLLMVAAVWIAPFFGREALSCRSDGPLQMQSWIYCLLNRNYVTPETSNVLHELADTVNQKYPGTVTLVLDANFPFLDGFPMLPHLSHDDGTKVDLAFYYADEDNYLPARTRSPIGYFAFEPGDTDCPEVWPTLRWNFNALQPLWHDYGLDLKRTRFALLTLANDERVEKILIEPHLKVLLQISDDKIRFQGCRAARHDDHIHLQTFVKPLFSQAPK